MTARSWAPELCVLPRHKGPLSSLRGGTAVLEFRRTEQNTCPNPDVWQIEKLRSSAGKGLASSLIGKLESGSPGVSPSPGFSLHPALPAAPLTLFSQFLLTLLSLFQSSIRMPHLSPGAPLCFWKGKFLCLPLSSRPLPLQHKLCSVASEEGAATAPTWGFST